MEKNDLKVGMRVHYAPKHGGFENGIVKSITDNYAFVVYKCGGEWHNYQNYTGAATEFSDLREGWNVKPIKQTT